MTEEQPKEVPQEAQTPAQDAQPTDKKERGRGNKRGFGRGQKRGSRGQEEEEWIPCTNLGRLVKSEYVKSLEEIYYHSIPIKEWQIVDFLYKKSANALKEECMKIKSVQNQTKAGQRTRFKAVVVVGDENGHIGVGSKVAKEVQIAMKGAVMAAKINLVHKKRILGKQNW